MKLALIKTNLGLISLHYTKKGHFLTRRKFTGKDGKDYTTDILLAPSQARHWYGLAHERGVVYKPFPKAAS